MQSLEPVTESENLAKISICLILLVLCGFILRFQVSLKYVILNCQVWKCQKYTKNENGTTLSWKNI